MRTTLAVSGGGGGGKSQGLRSRVGKMKRLLWLKPPRSVEVHLDTEPGVWLTSFQLLDTAGHCEVSCCRASHITYFTNNVHFAVVGSQLGESV